MRPLYVICKGELEGERGLIKYLQRKKLITVCWHKDRFIIARWGTNKKTLVKILEREVIND